jgi:hypothetical protein
MSTVATVLAAGIPMVGVPQGREQPLNAQRVADVAAGLQVAPDAPPVTSPQHYIPSSPTPDTAPPPGSSRQPQPNSATDGMPPT